jgi:hypothetical protein
MKDFNYYNTTNTEYLTYQQKEDYRQKLIDEINSEKLTADERIAKLDKVKKQVDNHERTYNKDARAEESRKKREFWEDAREELEYTEWLTEDAIMVLENKAWEDGHSSGYSEVFYQLQELVEFSEKLRYGIISPNQPVTKVTIHSHEYIQVFKDQDGKVLDSFVRDHESPVPTLLEAIGIKCEWGEQITEEEYNQYV